MSGDDTTAALFDQVAAMLGGNRVVERVQRVVDDVNRGDALGALESAGIARESMDRLELGAVRIARAQGWSWEQIGDALGVTKQAAQQRFGHRL